MIKSLLKLDYLPYFKKNRDEIRMLKNESEKAQALVDDL